MCTRSQLLKMLITMFLYKMYEKSESESRSGVSDSFQPQGLYSPGNSSGQPFLLQGIFPTQGLNPGLPHCRLILYQLSHQGNPQDVSKTFFFLRLYNAACGVLVLGPGIERVSSMLGVQHLKHWMAREVLLKVLC